MSFAHLHVHTEYSLLDGSNKIKEYVARVKELGMNSAAITDHGVIMEYEKVQIVDVNNGSRFWDVRFMWLRVPDLTKVRGQVKTDIIISCCLRRIRKGMRI